jgi:hypothetical protein
MNRDYDPFGDRISVVQDPPTEHRSMGSEGRTAVCDATSWAVLTDDHRDRWESFVHVCTGDHNVEHRCRCGSLWLSAAQPAAGEGLREAALAIKAEHDANGHREPCRLCAALQPSSKPQTTNESEVPEHG